MHKQPTLGSSLKFMSYNLFGWNAFRDNPWKKQNVFKNINKYRPHVMGAQEYEDGASSIKQGTGLTPAGNTGIYFDEGRLALEGTGRGNLKKDGWGYKWISVAKFKDKTNQQPFLFFNSHWAHGYSEQAQMALTFINEKVGQYGSHPIVLAGDTNQFGRRLTDKTAYKTLTAEGFSEVTVPNGGADQTTYCGRGPEGHVDVLFYKDFDVQRATIEKENCCCGNNARASDHAAVFAEATLR